MCVIGIDQRIACWDHSPNDDYIPVHLNAPEGAYVAVAAGGHHNCALRPDGTVTCWGDDRLGQLQAPLGAFSAIAASTNQTCGLRPDRQAECWGAGGHRAFPFAGPLTDLAAGIHALCALRPDGTVVCWGDADTPIPHFVQWV